MSVRFLFRLLALAVLLEILYLLIKTNFIWHLLVEYPTFCTTFNNDSENCYLDYEEGSSSFLDRYERYCEQNFIPEKGDSSLPICPCVPDSIKVKNASELNQYKVLKDGTSQPNSCIARQRVAIIVPFRNRTYHLTRLLKSLHAMLEKQLLAFQIFVIEQKSPAIFNKAMLMNAGYLEVSKNCGEFDCFIFHDVDMIPRDITNFYVCLDIPRHVGGFVEKFNFKLLYPGLFGGVTAFRKEHFEMINGFSNKFYGWGGEDDDMLQRVKASNLMVNRFPPSVSKYAMISHSSDPGNPMNEDRSSGYKNNPIAYRIDGLNSINYSVAGFEKFQGFAKFLISLPNPPTSHKTKTRTNVKRTDIADVHHWFIFFIFIIAIALFVIYHSG